VKTLDANKKGDAILDSPFTNAFVKQISMALGLPTYVLLKNETKHKFRLEDGSIYLDDFLIKSCQYFKLDCMNSKTNISPLLSMKINTILGEVEADGVYGGLHGLSIREGYVCLDDFRPMSVIGYRVKYRCHLTGASSVEIKMLVDV